MRKGFTLIELLVVVLIIGILSAIALPQYQLTVAKTRFARFLPLMRAVDTAQQVYYMTNGEYSKDLRNLDVQLPDGAKVQTATKFTYEEFECFLGNAPVLNSIYCVDTKYPFPMLEKYFNTSYAICWAGVADRLGRSVCQSLSGKTTNSGTSAGSLGDSYAF